MTTMKKLLMAPVAFSLLAGCGSTADPAGTLSQKGPLGGLLSNGKAPPSTTVNSSTVPGYVHRQEVSKFQVGGNVTHYTEFGLRKTDGSEGVFAVNVNNGSVQALSNAGSPGVVEEPLFATLQQHNDYVKNYFISLGLPADQIKDVQGTVMGEERGMLDEVENTGQPYNIKFYSILSRQVDGIPVSESFAWSRFAKSGRAVMETVYWPSLPVSVVTEAKQMQQVLADPVRSAPLRSLVPADAVVWVAIRHTSYTIDNPAAAYAVYDVRVDSHDGSLYNLHFDSNFKELRLPSESRTSPQVTKPTVPIAGTDMAKNPKIKVEDNYANTAMMQKYRYVPAPTTVAKPAQ